MKIVFVLMSVLAFISTGISYNKELPQKENSAEYGYIFQIQNINLYAFTINELLATVKKIAKNKNISHSLAIDSGADSFYKFTAKGAEAARHEIKDKTGKFVNITRLFAEVEFNEMTDVIDYLLKKS